MKIMTTKTVITSWKRSLYCSYVTFPADLQLKRGEGEVRLVLVPADHSRGVGPHVTGHINPVVYRTHGPHATSTLWYTEHMDHTPHQPCCIQNTWTTRHINPVVYRTHGPDITSNPGIFRNLKICNCFEAFLTPDYK